MEYEKLLSDFRNPIVEAKAAELAKQKTTRLEKLESIFSYVRDEIKFGFPSKWDKVKASETIGYRIGYCNTKATLFVALCRALDIPARVHCGLIDFRIMQGIVPSFAFRFIPEAGSHSWVDLQIGGEWKQIDSYINDKPFYDKALKKLRDDHQSLGYSICIADGKSSCEFNFGEKGFAQFGAVVEDHGVWDDASEYFATDKYTTFSAFQLGVYPVLAKLANRGVRRIRSANI
jgi:hypothetical protein